MRFISKYNDFMNEWSKNDPIPELNTKSKLGIILLGAPGVGKSTFVNKFIMNRNQNIKTFSTDDVSLMFTKDPNVYHKGSSEINLKRLKMFMESGQSFIYDTTGTQEENIVNLQNLAKSNGYTVIFIHIVAPLHVSISQNLSRDRQVPDDYIKMAYDNQFGNMGKYSKFGKYYIVQNKEGKYKINKYELGRIMKLTESNQEDLDIEMIHHIMDDIVEEFKDVILYDHDNKVYYLSQHSNDKQKNMNITKNVYNKKQSRFKICVELDSDYNRYDKLTSMLKVCVDRFSEFGWKVADISIVCSDFKFKRVTYVFSKEDEKVDGEFNEQEIYRNLETRFAQFGLSISDIQFSENVEGDYESRVEFESNMFQGEMPDKLSEYIGEISRLVGASDSVLLRNNLVVFIWWND